MATAPMAKQMKTPNFMQIDSGLWRNVWSKTSVVQAGAAIVSATCASVLQFSFTSTAEGQTASTAA